MRVSLHPKRALSGMLVACLLFPDGSHADAQDWQRSRCRIDKINGRSERPHRQIG